LLPGYKFEEGENKWALGFSLVLPILNQNEGPIAEAEARRREVSARFLVLQASVLGAIDGAEADYAGALQKLNVARGLYAAQEKQDRSTRARFQSGEVDRLAVLGARLELLTGGLSRLDAAAEAQKFLGLLEEALWRPLQPAGPPPPVPEANPRHEEDATR
jgi:cobalt-zinc-cadmium efflux system outer membrane protein